MPMGMNEGMERIGAEQFEALAKAIEASGLRAAYAAPEADFREFVHQGPGAPEAGPAVIAVPRGSLAFAEGQAGDSMFVVKSGMIAVFKGRPEDPTLIGLRGPGELLGEMSLIDGLARSASGLAIEDCALVRIARSGFEDLKLRSPGFSAALARLLSARLRSSDWASAERSARAQELELLDLKRNAFLADASHELRTPATLINSYLDGILKAEHGARIPFDSPVLKSMKKSADRLIKLVNGLLDAARMESGLGFDPLAVDVRAALAGYAAEFEGIAESGGVAIDARALRAAQGEGSCLAWVDPRAFETICLNLLSNAVKFTPSGGTVAVRAGQDPEEAGFIRLEVADTGIGIAPDQAEAIFDRFIQIKDSGGRSGSGIGLSLAREAARLSGGDIEVRSVPGRGSVFSVFLPRAAPDRSAEDGPAGHVRSTPDPRPPAARTRPGTPRPRLLVVEDDEDMRAFLAMCFETEYSVSAARNGIQALDSMRAGGPPDLVLSDIAMPGMDGPALLEIARREPGMESVPFVFLTARAGTDEKIRQLDGGAADFILKPFSVDELKARLRSILRAKAAERESMERRIVSALRSSGPEPRGSSDPTALGRAYGLSPREGDVFALLIEGRSDKEIAAELALSVKTVSHNVSQILRKAGAPSRGALIAATR